jgi:DNA-binding GntR family transcriptional regulator
MEREPVMADTALIAQSTGTATVDEWAKLDLNAPNSRVLRVTRIQHDETSRPVAREEVVLALERFPGLSPNGGGDVPDIIELAQRHGVSLGRATERVSIVQATKDVASHLQIAAGAAVMKLDRIVETLDGEPVEWCVTYRKI